ncbi:hypothetical protein [Methylobacterium segetis]|uniref:hypothetical protein n=1 Tax=Methylobacterium segetis TaxID=2488750 RepID=UPI00104D40CF|nr:hypothetical protein [Methylobacterium segetis]
MSCLSRIVLCGALFVSFSPAYSQESTANRSDSLPAKGDFRITFTAVNMNPMKPIMLDSKRAFTTGNSVMTAINQDGKGLLHNMAGRCTTAVTIDSDAKTFGYTGFCDYADKDGDHVFESYEYPVQPIAPYVKGSAEWTGGTGKFKGLSGKFDLRSSRLAAPVEGVTQTAGEKIGSYSIETTSASR